MDLKAVTRELQADEHPLLLAHLLALGAEDRRLRFEHALSDDGVRRYVEGICLSRDAVFVITDAASPSSVLPASPAEEHAQSGVSVLPPNGVGGSAPLYL